MLACQLVTPCRCLFGWEPQLSWQLFSHGNCSESAASGLLLKLHPSSKAVLSWHMCWRTTPQAFCKFRYDQQDTLRCLQLLEQQLHVVASSAVSAGTNIQAKQLCKGASLPTSGSCQHLVGAAGKQPLWQVPASCRQLSLRQLCLQTSSSCGNAGANAAVCF